MLVPHSSCTSARMAKSTSLGVLEHDTHLHIVDQDDILGLTQDVKNFSDGLAKLKAILIQPCECEEDLRVLAHERLGDVLCTLKSVLQRYPPLNTTELFSAAGALISKIKNFNYEEQSKETVDAGFSDAIDQLALEFSSSVSEYLMGDMHEEIDDNVKTKSYSDLLSVSQDTTDKDETEDEKEEIVAQMTVEEIDGTLMRLQAGLDLAFQRAKAWSKYLKDVMSYIERRAQLEVEYAKNLSRLATTVKPSLTEEVDYFKGGFLPLQSVYCTVLSQDVEYAKTCQATFTLLQTSKFVEPLATRRNDHDRIRKTLKDAWNKEVKRMQEAVSNLRKAQSMYVTRQQEHDKAKELAQKTETEMVHAAGQPSANLTAKVEKRKKIEDEALHKAAEAETTYKACVAEANNRQNVLQRVKTEMLAAIRDQILHSDQIIKKVTIEYFQILQTVSAPVPVQYHTLCEASKRYNPGSQYAEFVRRLPVSTHAVVRYEEFKFEPYNLRDEVPNRKVSTQSNESASSEHHSTEESPNLSSPRKDKYRTPVKAWGQQGGIVVVNSDTDSHSGSSKSLDSSPSNSPHPAGGGHKKMQLTGSLENLVEDEQHLALGVKGLLAVPGTDQLDVQSLVKRQGQRRNTTFGVDFQEQVDHYHSAVPPIITKCLKEVEKRGITVKGIYRVSGVKSTVENLCQRFELDPRSVSLDTENPNVISNVLKLYLRQLPEPLLTFKLYPSFINMAKENMAASLNKDATIERLHQLIDTLPFSNRKTCGVLMHHLQRIASYSDQNQMNASNLGIVFGPTLLRPQGGNASLACLVDTPHQTRVVELLIVNAETLFGPQDDHQVLAAETPVESLAAGGGDKKEAASSGAGSKTQPAADEPHDGNKQKVDTKKEAAPSPAISVTVQKDEIVPPNIPDPSLDRDVASSKRPGDTKIVSQKTGEEFYLPGSASFDKTDGGQAKASVLHHSRSEGQDIELENGYDSDNAADSDINSDEDLPLPDDSHSSQLTQNMEHETRFGAESMPVRLGSTLTPPLPSHHHNKGLPSPASSPNLTTRGTCSAPPSIKIDNVTFGSEPQPSHGSETQLTQSKIYQLPPVNTWNPKGDSLFNSILDSRSPQVFRRTSSGKTASFPGSASSNTSSRVSWPQTSPEQLSPPLARYESETISPPTASITKSPKLVKKCTSFDLERSKPFPARSSISSPRLLRKSMSFDDDDEFDKPAYGVKESPTFGKKLGALSDSHPKVLEHAVLKEVDDEEMEVGEAPTCSSDANMVPQNEPGIDTVSGEAHTNTPLTTTDTYNETDALHEHTDELKDRGVKFSEREESPASFEDIGVQTSPRLELGARPKRKATDDNKRPHMPKTVPGSTKSKSAAAKTPKEKTKVTKSPSGPIMGKSVLKPKTNGQNGSKSATSSVKTALKTSAAKLKSIGRRNPVTLLSYKSASITIPDHTDRFTTKLEKARGKLVRQSESSPMVLVTEHGSTPERKVKSEESSVKRSKPKVFQKSSKPPQKPSTTTTCSHGHPTARAPEKPKRSAARATKPYGETATKSSTLRSEMPEKCERHTRLSSKSNKSTEDVVAAAAPSSKASGSKKTKDIKEKWSDDKAKGRAGKRGSVDSIHGEPARKTDHFRDCCHGRRK